MVISKSAYWPFSEELASDERVRSSKVQRTFSVVALKAGL
jgi:hypothetical protein